MVLASDLHIQLLAASCNWESMASWESNVTHPGLLFIISCTSKWAGSLVYPGKWAGRWQPAAVPLSPHPICHHAPLVLSFIYLWTPFAPLCLSCQWVIISFHLEHVGAFSSSLPTVCSFLPSLPLPHTMGRIVRKQKPSHTILCLKCCLPCKISLVCMSSD